MYFYLYNASCRLIYLPLHVILFFIVIGIICKHQYNYLPIYKSI